MAQETKWCSWSDVPESLRSRIDRFVDENPEWKFWGSLASAVYDMDHGRSVRIYEMARHYDRCDLFEAMKALRGDQEMIATLEKRERLVKELREIAGDLRKVEELVATFA